MPGESSPTMNWLKPAWRWSGSSGLVRASTTIRCARWAPLVHTLVPLSDQPSSVRFARVLTAARSDPASCSLIPIAAYSRPAAITGSRARRCSSVPYDNSDGRELTIGEPVRGDRRTVCQQFLGHHVAVQMPQPASAVLGGDGQTDEPRVAQSRGEAGVPSGQPGVDSGLPAELFAIGGEKLPDVCPQFGQLRVVGAQCVEFGHWP